MPTVPQAGQAGGSRETWLVGDSQEGDDRHHRRMIQFSQPEMPDWHDYYYARMGRTAPPAYSYRMKGDRQWIAEGQSTPMTECGCSMCGAAFYGHPSARVCLRCARFLNPEEVHVGQDAQWRSMLRTDVPRLVPNPGKVAERQRCKFCGALEPHICYARNRPVEFDDDQDRAGVGFLDRGVRRYQPFVRSMHHPGGWTSGPDAFYRLRHDGASSSSSRHRRAPILRAETARRSQDHHDRARGATRQSEKGRSSIHVHFSANRETRHHDQSLKQEVEDTASETGKSQSSSHDDRKRSARNEVSRHHKHRHGNHQNGRRHDDVSQKGHALFTDGRGFKEPVNERDRRWKERRATHFGNQS